MSEQVYFKEVDLMDGTKVTIHKLKSGKYYVAQQLFCEWLASVTSHAKAEGTTQDMFSIIKDDSAGGFRSKMVAMALDKPAEEVEENYYPEDVASILEAFIAVNNFSENLKKFLAPLTVVT